MPFLQLRPYNYDVVYKRKEIYTYKRYYNKRSVLIQCRNAFYIHNWKETCDLDLITVTLNNSTQLNSSNDHLMKMWRELRFRRLSCFSGGGGTDGYIQTHIA